MQELKIIVDIINSIKELILAIGIVPVFWLLVLLFVMHLVSKYLKERKDNFYYNSMIKEKNQNIELLADDNRRYREIYLKNIAGLPEDVYKNISAETIKKPEESNSEDDE